MDLCVFDPISIKITVEKSFLSRLPVLLCLLRFEKNVKIHPDLGTPKRYLLSAMCVGCERRSL